MPLSSRPPAIGLSFSTGADTEQRWERDEERTTGRMQRGYKLKASRRKKRGAIGHRHWGPLITVRGHALSESPHSAALCQGVLRRRTQSGFSLRPYRRHTKDGFSSCGGGGGGGGQEDETGESGGREITLKVFCHFSLPPRCPLPSPAHSPNDGPRRRRRHTRPGTAAAPGKRTESAPRFMAPPNLPCHDIQLPFFFFFFPTFGSRHWK